MRTVEKNWRENAGKMSSEKYAVSTAALLPESRLLSSDSWGHTAYGTSACVPRTTPRCVPAQGYCPPWRPCCSRVPGGSVCGPPASSSSSPRQVWSDSPVPGTISNAWIAPG